jgi:hypothetical protein
LLSVAGWWLAAGRRDSVSLLRIAIGAKVQRPLEMATNKRAPNNNKNDDVVECEGKRKEEGKKATE